MLGSIEGGLIVTTINPWYTSEEISRQFTSCQPKAVFCLVDNYEVVKKACVLSQQPQIKIITVKHSTTDSTPNDAINVDELMNPNGKDVRVLHNTTITNNLLFHFRSHSVRNI